MSLSAVLVLSVQTAATTVVLTVEIVVPTGETAVQTAAMTVVMTAATVVRTARTVEMTDVQAATSARATRPRPLRWMTSKSRLKKSSRFFQFPRQSPE